MTDQLTARTLAAASALLQAAADDDRFAMRRLLRIIHEPGASDQVGEVVRQAALTYGTDVGLVLSGSRVPHAIRARQVACYAASLLGHTYSHIGRQVGRDHSTVMHACAKTSADPNMREIAESIASQLGWNRAGEAS